MWNAFAMCVLDFEVKHKEEVERPHGLPIGIPVQNRDQPDEIPVECGSVLRQKNEIEMKYGSSPRHSKLSPDHSLCPPSVSPSDTARLTPTLEKYCSSDILSLTEEVPEGFLDEDGKDVHECSWQKRRENESPQPSPFPDQNLPESDLKRPTDAGSQFQRSFSYRENCQQKQSKASPFFSRSASFRLRGLSDATKCDNAVVDFVPGIVSKTNISSFASFSSTEVCRRLLKEKSQHSECTATDKLCDLRSENMQVKHADRGTEKDKQVLPLNVLDTVQLPSQQVPLRDSSVGSHTESFSGSDDTNCSYTLHHGLKTDATKSVVLPVVSQDQQPRPASAFVPKAACQQSTSHSSRTEQSGEPSALRTHLSGKVSSVASDVQPSSTAGSSDCRKVVAGNTASVDVSSSLTGDRVLESHKVFTENDIRSQSTEQLTQVDASGVESEPAVQSVQPLPSEQVRDTSSITQPVASQAQSNDVEQCQLTPLKKRFSFRDKSASFILNEPEKLFRSQSVSDKSTSSFLRRGNSEIAEAWKAKKPYGKSHPLSKLSSDYLSRKHSTTIKDSTCDRDTM